MPNASLLQRIQSLSQLGVFLSSALKPTDKSSEQLLPILEEAMAQNRWFTHDSMRQALGYWAEQLNQETLRKWMISYAIKETNPKRVLLILAGNIPLVGFHDVLCTYVSGHISVIKSSQKDSVLIGFMIKQLQKIDKHAAERFELVPHTTTNFEAVIATGSTNSSRYFDYYFNSYPHIIRRNRNSVAYVNNALEQAHLELLCKDVFDYYGLGCRNVTHLIIEQGFDLNRLVETFYQQTELLAHNKYMNNVDYHRSLFILNGQSFIDANGVLLSENRSISSPIGVIHFHWVTNRKEADSWILSHQQEIQCAVGLGPSYTSFGESQRPSLDKYADQIDTLDFLLAL